ncbi:MAG: S8 family serine peptidase, partial [Pyrinomonadaceae bacterium]
LSAGDLTLTYVLNGFDYILSHKEQLNIRIVNCSFSANTVFDTNDPVNVATRILTDGGVNVVFSAGNDGPGANTINPYSVAPWVVSVGATDNKARLASFSSRGAFGSALFHPTLVAPGVNSVSLRAAGVNLTGIDGIASAADTSALSPTELPFYTVASGTSFSAPEVAGTIALMLQANPQLGPAQVRDILARTATPLTPYFAYEVGAGMLNSHAALLEAAFPQRRMGMFRAVLDRGQAHFVSDPIQEFGGSVGAGGGIYETTLSVPEHAFVSSVQIAWGPTTNTNDLALALFDPGGTRAPGGDTINQTGLTGHHESVSTDNPQSGAWRVRVTNGTNTLTGTMQSFAGTFEVTRVAYPQFLDVDSLGAQSREEVYRAMRTFTMSPYSLRFRPNFPVSRFDLASALLMGARVPQYLPAQPSYTDVRDGATMIAIESVQAAPGGPFFTDATAGGAFRPFDSATRLAAAVAFVRAAGLGAEAEAANRATHFEMTPAELAVIPVNLRGYVSVAISYSLLTTETGVRSASPLTRAELAHALSMINDLQTH